MTATRSRKRIPFCDSVEVVDAELEMSLVWGRGFSGVSRLLRSLDDWRRHWERWRSVIEPKNERYRPGYRPVAAYVCGELEDRPVLIEPPRSADFFRIWVADSTPSGRWLYRYPPPYMQLEPQWLRELRVVGVAEWQRYREARYADQRFAEIDTPNGYPLEVGLYG